MEYLNNYEKDLIEFKAFLKTYEFNQLEVIESDGNLYCCDILVKDSNGYVGVTDKFINVGYTISGTFPKLLSNLFPYEFEFRGIKLNFIECFFT